RLAGSRHEKDGTSAPAPPKPWCRIGGGTPGAAPARPPRARAVAALVPARVSTARPERHLAIVGPPLLRPRAPRPLLRGARRLGGTLLAAVLAGRGAPGAADATSRRSVHATTRTGECHITRGELRIGGPFDLTAAPYSAGIGQCAMSTGNSALLRM